MYYKEISTEEKLTSIMQDCTFQKIQRKTSILTIAMTLEGFLAIEELISWSNGIVNFQDLKSS